MQQAGLQSPYIPAGSHSSSTRHGGNGPAIQVDPNQKATKNLVSLERGL